jgi:hypothetical protein
MKIELTEKGKWRGMKKKQKFIVRCDDFERREARGVVGNSIVHTRLGITPQS